MSNHSPLYEILRPGKFALLAYFTPQGDEAFLPKFIQDWKRRIPITVGPHSLIH